MSAAFTDVTDADAVSTAASVLVERMTVTLASSGRESNGINTHVQLPKRLATVNNYYSVSKGLADTLKCLASELVENMIVHDQAAIERVREPQRLATVSNCILQCQNG